MSENLKSCPFCGGSAKLYEVRDGQIYYEIWCTHCGVRTEQYETEAEAIEKWNHRVERTAKIDFSESVPHCTACENPLSFCDNDR